MGWSRKATVMRRDSNVECPAGDGPILAGQYFRIEWKNDTYRTLWHDDCAEDYGMGPYGGVLHLQEPSGVSEPTRPPEYFRLRGLPQAEHPSVVGE